MIYLSIYNMTSKEIIILDENIKVDNNKIKINLPYESLSLNINLKNLITVIYNPLFEMVEKGILINHIVKKISEKLFYSDPETKFQINEYNLIKSIKLLSNDKAIEDLYFPIPFIEIWSKFHLPKNTSKYKLYISPDSDNININLPFIIWLPLSFIHLNDQHLKLYNKIEIEFTPLSDLLSFNNNKFIVTWNNEYEKMIKITKYGYENDKEGLCFFGRSKSNLGTKLPLTNPIYFYKKFKNVMQISLDNLIDIKAIDMYLKIEIIGKYYDNKTILEESYISFSFNNNGGLIEKKELRYGNLITPYFYDTSVPDEYNLYHFKEVDLKKPITINFPISISSNIYIFFLKKD